MYPIYNYYCEKKIRNPKYLFFILKNKLFETLTFLPYIPKREGEYVWLMKNLIK